MLLLGVLSVETTGGRLGPVSRLRVKAASPSDSGNYSCSAPDADTATVLIQVLDGESHIRFFIVLVRKTELRNDQSFLEMILNSFHYCGCSLPCNLKIMVAAVHELSLSTFSFS